MSGLHKKGTSCFEPLELVKLGGSMVQRISLSSIQHVSSLSGKTNLFVPPLGCMNLISKSPNSSKISLTVPYHTFLHTCYIVAFDYIRDVNLQRLHNADYSGPWSFRGNFMHCQSSCGEWNISMILLEYP